MPTGSPEEKMGEIRTDDSVHEVFGGQIDLPRDENRRAICAAHLAEGRLEAMMNEFWMAGCHFPEEGTDNTAVHLAVSCAGLSRFRKQCRLTLTQTDDNGKVLTTGTWPE